jgi:hypothetical protein
MVYKCGNEITPHIPAITKLCLQYICYDPNYNYEEETDADDEEMECDDEVIFNPLSNWSFLMLIDVIVETQRIYAGIFLCI